MLAEKRKCSRCGYVWDPNRKSSWEGKTSKSIGDYTEESQEDCPKCGSDFSRKVY